jgi:hypothetical protein
MDDLQAKLDSIDARLNSLNDSTKPFWRKGHTLYDVGRLIEVVTDLAEIVREQALKKPS